MPEVDTRDSVLAAWRTSCLVTAGLIEGLPTPLWGASIPGIAPRRTIRSMAAHLHNARSRWIRTLGTEFGITAPRLVDRNKVTRRGLQAALKKSGLGIERLLRLGFDSGGEIPAAKAYVWRNLPLDVGHVLAYFVAHEAHHRGQLVMAVRQLGVRLQREVTNGLWQFAALRRVGCSGRPVPVTARLGGFRGKVRS